MFWKIQDICYQIVSTVTFSQSQCHVLQHIITRNLHSKRLLSAVLLCMAQLSDFYRHQAKLFQIYNFVQHYFNSESY